MIVHEGRQILAASVFEISCGKTTNGGENPIPATDVGVGKYHLVTIAICFVSVSRYYRWFNVNITRLPAALTVHFGYDG